MNYRMKIEGIRKAYLRGEVPYDTAKEEVETLLVKMNEAGEKIAKKYGRKFTKFTFQYVFR